MLVLGLYVIPRPLTEPISWRKLPRERDVGQDGKRTGDLERDCCPCPGAADASTGFLTSTQPPQGPARRKCSSLIAGRGPVGEGGRGSGTRLLPLPQTLVRVGPSPRNPGRRKCLSLGSRQRTCGGGRTRIWNATAALALVPRTLVRVDPSPGDPARRKCSSLVVSSGTAGEEPERGERDGG